MPRTWVSFVVLLTVGVSACGHAPASQPPPRSHDPSTVRWTIAGAVGAGTLDPAQATDTASIGIISLLDEGLVRLGRNMQIEPAAAASWRVFDHGRRYRFTLRRGLRFSNGRRLTAADVVASFDRALASASQNGVMANYVPELVRIRSRPAVSVAGNGRVQFDLAYPSPAFLAKLTFSGASIVDMATIHRYGAVWTAHADGLGPYRLHRRLPGGSLTLTPNRFFRPQSPALSLTVQLAPVRAAITGFRLGHTDIVTGLPAGVPLPNSVRKEARVAPLQALDYVVLNTRHPPLNNWHTRHALALAVNRKQLTREVFGASATQVGTVVPPPLLPGASRQSYVPAEALRQLAIAHHADSQGIRPLRFIYVNTPTEQRRAGLLQAMWNQTLGLQVTLHGLSYPSYVAAVREGRFDLATVQWGAEYPDAADFLAAQLRGGSRQDFARWNNPHFNRLISESQKEPTSSGARRQLLLSAARIASEQAPWIPLDSPLQLALIRSSLPFVLTPHGVMGFAPGR